MRSCREKSYSANFTLKIQSFVSYGIRATTEEMEAMNEKLDMVLNKLEKIESRLELFEKNLAKNTKKIKAIDNCCDEIEKLTQNTVTLAKFEALEGKIEQLKAALKSKNNQINNVSDKMKTLNCSLNKFQKRTAQELLEKEIYDKRFNLLIHGIEENDESAWETKWESENKFKQFLRNGLKIPNFHAVAVADVHRLPQHSITENGKRITPLIIVKLTSYSDKNMIMRSLKNLKDTMKKGKKYSAA